MTEKSTGLSSAIQASPIQPIHSDLTDVDHDNNVLNRADVGRRARPETTLPHQDAQFVEATKLLGRLPFNQRVMKVANEELEESRQYQVSYLQWAKEFLSMQKEPPD